MGEYVDHVSAADLRGRVAWRELWAADSWDVLVVIKLDRGWRSVLAMLTDVERLDAHGRTSKPSRSPTSAPAALLGVSCSRSWAPSPSSSVS